MGGLRSLVSATYRLFPTQGEARLSFPLGLRILPSLADPACLRVGFASAFLLFAYAACDCSPVQCTPLYTPGLDPASRAQVATTSGVHTSPSGQRLLLGNLANSPSSRPHKVRARGRPFTDAADTAVNQTVDRIDLAPPLLLLHLRTATLLAWNPGIGQHLLDSP